jgi:hypothetical protein
MLRVLINFNGFLEMVRTNWLLSIDFDGTLVGCYRTGVFNSQCMELIRELQDAGTILRSTGRSVDLRLRKVSPNSLPIRPDFILTTEQTFFVRQNGRNGNRSARLNQRCAHHADLFSSRDHPG